MLARVTAVVRNRWVRSLTVHAQKYGGVTDASKIGFAKLTTVFEKLTDLANGIERLRAASAKLPDGRYAAICR